MQFVSSSSVLILHAGETGNAEEVAYEIQSKLSVRTIVQPIDQYDIMNLPDEKYIVFITSTTGEGDTPEIMKKFWGFLLRRSLANDALAGLNYAVFGLGDSSYEQFNAVARKLDRRLQMLGAKPMNPLGLGDDQATFGYLSALNNWLASLTSYMQQVGLQHLAANNSVHTPYYVISCADSTAAHTASELVGASSGKEVFATSVVENRRLTAAVWGQDVRHVKLQIDRSMDTTDPLYEVGDVAMVYYRNPAELVNRALSLIVEGAQRHNETFSATSVLHIELCGPRRTSRLGSIRACSLRTLLEQHLDIGAVPKRSYFSSLAPYATNPEEEAKLLELASDAGTDLYFDYCTKERKSYVEVLEEFRSCRPPLAVLLGALQVVPARQYSIASSPLLCPRTIELCVAVSQRTTPYGRRRTGLCSGFISKLAPGDVVYVSIKPGCIRGTSLGRSGPPDSAADRAAVRPEQPVPSILVGPGTGVAPMRALIQHEVARQALSSSLAAESSIVAEPPALPTPNMLLFFGCRKQERDHLYAADWALINDHRNPYTLTAGYAHGPYVAELQPGAVAVHSAFSQDQLVKVYVTHKIKEQGKLVCWMLQQGANVFVVGSSKRMPADVRKALCAVLEEHAGLSAAESDAYLQKLAKAKKYIVEAW